MNATFLERRSIQFGWIDWLQQELVLSHERKARTAILACGAVLVVIISMTLQVPYLAVSAYMVFFFSKENKVVTTVAGLLGVLGVTIAIGISLLLYKFTGHRSLSRHVPVAYLCNWAARVCIRLCHSRRAQRR